METVEQSSISFKIIVVLKKEREREKVLDERTPPG